MDLAMSHCFISCFLTFHPCLTFGPLPPLVPLFQFKYFFCTLLFNNCRRGISLLLHWTVAHSQGWTHKVNLLTNAITDNNFLLLLSFKHCFIMNLEWRVNAVLWKCLVLCDFTSQLVKLMQTLFFWIPKMYLNDQILSSLVYKQINAYEGRYL